MITFAKTSSKLNYLFGLLPSWFKQEDSYVPNLVPGYENEGFLERYMEIFCLEIDNKLSPYLDGVGLLVDAASLSDLPHDDPNIFLTHIAADLGNPPDIGTIIQYINLLVNTRLINQHKGTRKGVELFLAVFGYEITNLMESSILVKKYDATPTPLKYDSGVQYDYGFTFYSGWDLEITDVPGTGTKNPSSLFLDLLKESIQRYISPVFATLNNLTYTI